MRGLRKYWGWLLFAALITTALKTSVHSRASAMSAVVGESCSGASSLPATAVATNQGRQMLSNLVAAPLGGALLSLGRVVPFAVDSASYLIAAIAASGVRTPLAPEQSASQTKTLAAMREGIRWLWTRRGMRQILLGGTVLNFA